LQAKKEYTVELSKRKILDPDGTIVAGQEYSAVVLPDNGALQQEHFMVSDETKFLDIVGKDFIVEENCMFSIVNETGETVIGTTLE
jgi:hypothetical protein